MSLASVIGRGAELAKLQALHDSGGAQFLALYGRRRIGKTFLLSQFFQDKGLYFELTGIKDADLKTQLGNFARECADAFNAGKPSEPPDSWFEAFDLLRKRAAQRTAGEKMVIFLDELPWLASPRSQLLEALDHAWNRYLSREKDLILIVCGSAASWMIKKVLNDKGGLHGRLTAKMQLLPFDLNETRQYLQAQNVRFPPQHLIELYMALGGVAHYLTGLPTGQSVDQIVQSRYFDKNAPLRGEFHKLFASLFGDYGRHLAVIRALAASHYGLTADQLLTKANMQSGGGFSDTLRELRESGFIAFLPQFGSRKKAGKYLLTDEFTLFYLKWVEQWEDELADLTGYWQRQWNTQSFRSWAGYAFETLCVKNIGPIKQQLGIAGVTTKVSQWRGDGAQIDLVIDRADRCINLCEIKFHNTEYVMTARDAADMQRKKTRFVQDTATRKAVFLTLITLNDAARNSHYVNTVDSHVRAERFVAL